jgi:hypothetical protein
MLTREEIEMSSRLIRPIAKPPEWLMAVFSTYAELGAR